METFIYHLKANASKKWIWIALVFISNLSLAAFPRISVDEYVEQYKNIAITEMHNYRIPASITLAQGILESEFGNSYLATAANNHFGIKCHKDWNGLSVRKDDDAKDECFRKYASAVDSYEDHSLFLSKRGRYSSLFELKMTDYKSWAKGLKKAGYATNPQYAHQLIKLIDNYDLNRFDTGEPLSEEQYAETVEKERQEQIFYYNRIKTIVFTYGVTPKQVADAYNIDIDRLCKYNDVKRSDFFPADAKIYLQPKRGKGPINKRQHLVEANQTMRDIAQLYGIKLEKLYKLNQMLPGTQPQKGELINLRKKRGYPPMVTADFMGAPTPLPSHDLSEKTQNREQPSAPPYEPQNNKEITQVSETEVPDPVVKKNDNKKVKQLYVVREGDNLNSIAEQFGASLYDLIKINDLGKEDVQAGDKLIVPAKVK